ncbi:MAG: hypothetical protein KA004_13450 [Verrucomicrobiales bacterium]|nr:hypothetical protein [Verrucomicrobiales bacterium]
MAFSVDQAFGHIAQAARQGRLAHGFLISGPFGEDLKELARRVANLVNGWDAAEFSDLAGLGAHVVEPDSKSRRIKIDPMRSLEQGLQLTSHAACKLGIVVDADRMTEPAANAFLKTLEEPPPGTLLLLLTRQPEQLLPTVRSRCVRVPLFRPGLQGMDLTPEQEQMVEALGRHFQGDLNPNRAMALLRQFQELLGEIRERIQKANEAAHREEVEEYAKSTDGSWLKGRKEYHEDLTESQYQEERNALLALLFVWMGEIMRRQAGAPALELPGCSALTSQLAAQFSAVELRRRHDAIEELRRNLATNAREALALEVGFLKAFG